MQFLNFKVDIAPNVYKAMKYSSIMFSHLTVRKWKSDMGYRVISTRDIVLDDLSENTLSLFGQ